MMAWIKRRMKEKTTWFAILMFLGAVASMPVKSFETITLAFVNAGLGALAGATTKKDLSNL